MFVLLAEALQKVRTEVGIKDGEEEREGEGRGRDELELGGVR